jgi:hypothetical protein
MKVTKKIRGSLLTEVCTKIYLANFGSRRSDKTLSSHEEEGYGISRKKSALHTNV